MAQFLTTRLWAALALVAMISSLATASAAVTTVAGKVVNVSHQKVTLAPNKVADKVTVTIERCDAPGTLATLEYSPSSISDRSTLGFLWDANLQQARSMVAAAPQPQINGFGLFWVDEKNAIQRSGFLGHEMGCASVAQLVKQFP